MPLMTYLELNTAHMRSTDNDLLESFFDSEAVDHTNGGRPAHKSVIVDRVGGHGFYIDAGVWNSDGGKRAERALREGFSQEFIDIMKRADDLGLHFVRFDADGDIDGDYPHFDWEDNDAKYEGDEYCTNPVAPGASL